MHPPPTVLCGAPLSLVIGSTLGKSSASKPLLWMSNAWHSLFAPVFHLSALLLSASSKMLFASAKNFLPLLGPSVLQIAPWQSWEVAAKCLFALTLVFHCLETWQGFLEFSTFLLSFCPTLLEHLLQIFFLSLSAPLRCTFRVSACSEHISHWTPLFVFFHHFWYITLWENVFVKTNIYTYWIAMKINLIIIFSYLLFYYT